jgi:hypothetical protein
MMLIDRGESRPPGRRAPMGGCSQEQGLALLIGVAGPFGVEVVGEGVAGVAAEEDRSAGGPLPRTLFSFAFFTRRNSAGSAGSS